MTDVRVKAIVIVLEGAEGETQLQWNEQTCRWKITGAQEIYPRHINLMQSLNEIVIMERRNLK